MPSVASYKCDTLNLLNCFVTFIFILSDSSINCQRSFFLPTTYKGPMRILDLEMKWFWKRNKKIRVSFQLSSEGQLETSRKASTYISSTLLFHQSFSHPRKHTSVWKQIFLKGVIQCNICSIIILQVGCTISQDEAAHFSQKNSVYIKRQ